SSSASPKSMNAPVYAPCSGIATSTGPFGSTCATATPRRQPISAKLDAIAAAITTKTAWLRIWFRTVRTKNGISRVEAASKTITGKEYKDATVTRIEPDGIVLTNKAGIGKIYFTELPKDVQQRFGYDPQRAANYSAQQSAGLDQVRKEQVEASRREAEATQ